METLQTAVVICGAGPVGLTLAHLFTHTEVCLCRPRKTMTEVSTFTGLFPLLWIIGRLTTSFLRKLLIYPAKRPIARFGEPDLPVATMEARA